MQDINITDWLMVGITAVYVLATIAICMANFKSVKAAKEQLSETKHQYSETQRLQVMPYLQLTFTESDTSPASPCWPFDLRDEANDGTKAQFFFTIKNIGLGIAHHTSINVNIHNKKEVKHSFPDIVIPPSYEKSTYVEVVADKYFGMQPKKVDINILFMYEDVLGNTYRQEARLILVVDDYGARMFHLVDMKSPQLVAKSEEKPSA